MSKKRGAVYLFIMLLGFWFILASKITLTNAIIGFVVSWVIVFYNYDLVFLNHEFTKVTLKTTKAFFVLVGVVLYNIAKSNIDVARIVLDPKMPINPGFDWIKQPLKKDMNRALYANAITLTPGTLTVDMTEEYILIHGLNVEQIKDIPGSSLEKVFIKLEEAEQ